MASPHAGSFICLPFASIESIREGYEIYYVVCLCSAVVGTIGSLVFFYQVVRGTASNSVSRSQKNILINLAIADFFADIGVIIRSLYYLMYWVKFWQHYSDHSTDLRSNLAPTIGSTIIQLWVIFWYLVSYFWTFFFAVDIYTSKHDGKWRLFCSHIVTWVYCIVLSSLSILALWVCSPQIHCAVDKYCLVGHFLSTFGPILIFLVSLPIFYISTLQKMEESFRKNLAVDEVRKREKELAKKKILVFILAFYFCWFVNVIDGIIQIVVHLEADQILAPSPSFLYEPGYIYSVWIIEALVNPLQGLLNALVYGNTLQCITNSCKSLRNNVNRKYSNNFISWSGEHVDIEEKSDTLANKHRPTLKC